MRPSRVGPAIIAASMRNVRTFVLLMLVLLAAPLYAYIDPGAGSLLLQLIIGGVAGAFITLKLFWGRLRNRSKGKSESSVAESEPPTSD